MKELLEQKYQLQELIIENTEMLNILKGFSQGETNKSKELSSIISELEYIINLQREIVKFICSSEIES